MDRTYTHVIPNVYNGRSLPFRFFPQIHNAYDDDYDSFFMCI